MRCNDLQSQWFELLVWLKHKGPICSRYMEYRCASSNTHILSLTWNSAIMPDEHCYWLASANPSLKKARNIYNVWVCQPNSRYSVSRTLPNGKWESMGQWNMHSSFTFNPRDIYRMQVEGWDKCFCDTNVLAALMSAPWFTAHMKNIFLLSKYIHN